MSVRSIAIDFMDAPEMRACTRADKDWSDAQDDLAKLTDVPVSQRVFAKAVAYVELHEHRRRGGAGYHESFTMMDYLLWW